MHLCLFYPFLCVAFLFCGTSLLFPVVSCKGLTDDPIAGDSLRSLDGQWTATDGVHTIQAAVPGDLITDLYNAKLMGDPLYETNWIQSSSLWDGSTWNYSTSFQYDKEISATAMLLLVFDGVKMGAVAYLNDVKLGVMNDQFLRYSYDITNIIKSGTTNTLVVSFPNKNEIDCEGRFMACSGGWDWAPYSNTVDQHGSPTLSKGIWKSVYLVSASTALITHVVTQVTYKADYPLEMLSDMNHGPFMVAVSVHIMAPSPIQGRLSVVGEWGDSAIIPVSLPQGESMFTLSLLAKTVSLWWPSGLGQPNMFQIDVSWIPQAGQSVKTSRRIGFRVFTLVSANDTVPSSLAGKDGSSTFTMRFRINGASVWSRGGNVIPMEEYEGRASADALRGMVVSAMDGRMNTLRVWGGGIFMYDAFYDACDELGLMVYHDMMYAQQGHVPSQTETQDAELRHQIRRLSHHPSIVIWDGCNECDGLGLYQDFVMKTVAQEDQSRPIWPSCPSRGWTHGVDSLWGFPNGVTLATLSGSNPHETHGPYQHGNGFKTVNDPDGKLVLFDANIPPNLPAPTPSTGPEMPGVYASEFGCVAMSSFESMTPTLDQEHWSLHADPMYQRNYPCDNVVDVYWGTQDFSQTGELAFKRQLYQCLLGQALELKSNIEVRRATNEMGTVLWQLNEIWPTGGWGTIEYGTPVEGQVIGGRWKPFHYWLRRSVFTDLIATCGYQNTAPVTCYVKNDGVTGFLGSVTISVVLFATGKINNISVTPVNLSSGPGSMLWFCAQQQQQTQGACGSWSQVLESGGCSTFENCILILEVKDASQNVVSRNELALTTPKSMILPKPQNINLNVSETGLITIVSDSVAAYFTLTTKAAGRFADNTFLLLPGKTEIMFIPFGVLDVQTLRETLRYEHVQIYQM